MGTRREPALDTVTCPAPKLPMVSTRLLVSANSPPVTQTLPTELLAKPTKAFERMTLPPATVNVPRENTLLPTIRIRDNSVPFDTTTFPSPRLPTIVVDEGFVRLSEPPVNQSVPVAPTLVPRTKLLATDIVPAGKVNVPAPESPT